MMGFLKDAAAKRVCLFLGVLVLLALFRSAPAIRRCMETVREKPRTVWIGQCAKIQPGMSPDEVIGIMGKPESLLYYPDGGIEMMFYKAPEFYRKNNDRRGLVEHTFYVDITNNVVVNFGIGYR